VHIEEVLEDQPETTNTGPLPGFICPDPDEMTQGDRLFVCFISEQLEEVRAAQTISQKLVEVVEETCSTHFEDIVPKPYQKFKDALAKESFDKFPDQKKWDLAIKLVPDSQMFSTKVCPLVLIEQKQLNDFLNENLKSCIYAHLSHQWHPPSSSSSRERWKEASASSKIIRNSKQ